MIHVIKVITCKYIVMFVRANKLKPFIAKVSKKKYKDFKGIGTYLTATYYQLTSSPRISSNPQNPRRWDLFQFLWWWPSNMCFLFCLVILLPWSWFNWVWLSWFWCVLKPKIPMDKILRAGPGINFQFKHQHVPTSLGWNSCTDLQDTYGLNFGPESGTPKKRLKVGLEPKSFSRGPERGIFLFLAGIKRKHCTTTLSIYSKWIQFLFACLHAPAQS